MAGILLGHTTRRWNPKISTYTYGIKKNIPLIDLVKTRKQLEKAQNFVAKIRRSGKDILFVGTKIQAAGAIKERAQISKSFFVRKRWLGGIITNWATVRLSLLKLHRLEREQKVGNWMSLTKKDVSLLEKRLIRLESYFGGLKGIRSLPGRVVIVGQNVEFSAIQECRKLNIPTVCRLDTDCDPDLVEVGVPINDDSTARINLFLKTLVPRINDGRLWWISKKYKG